MTMPTIEDLDALHRDAMSITLALEGGGYETDVSRRARAMCAVLDALKPVVAEAFYEGTDTGFYCESRHSDKECGCADKRDTYAARIIAQLKGESRE